MHSRELCPTGASVGQRAQTKGSLGMTLQDRMAKGREPGRVGRRPGQAAELQGGSSGIRWSFGKRSLPPAGMLMEVPFLTLYVNIHDVRPCPTEQKGQ